MSLDACDLDAWVDAHRDDLVRCASWMMAHPSVGEALDASSAHPFGDDCATMVDATREVAERLEMAWRNHGYYAASLRANEGAPHRIAFFSHVDVVPAGDGWHHDPFDPYVRDGWLFGRGSTDNKGPATAVLFAVRYLMERGLLRNSEVVVYLGCDEERGMEDVRYLVATEPAADVSLVSDCAFPTCVAEKGVLGGVLSWRLDDGVLLGLEAGTAHNAVAGSATARVRDAEGMVRQLVWQGRGGHAAFPEGSSNAIVLAAADLAVDGRLTPETRATFAKVGQLLSTNYGESLGIAVTDDFMGPLTCVATRAWLDDDAAGGRWLRVELNVRYPDCVTPEWLERRIVHVSAGAGAAFEVTEASPAHRARGNGELAAALTGVVNQTLGTNLVPYSLPGATHARWIPGALGFGASFPMRAHSHAPAHGNGHEPDEAVCIDDLLDAVRVYVRAIALLDERLG